ncbi:hypothetical protein [Candidatus Binatus sp.]|uniref:hypothetical protein n=1 Tax=Candidatus Binatus sp. TaxID=2811406 RepID=UPI003BB1EA49
MAQPRRQSDRIDLSAASEKLSLIAGLTAGLAYSIFASFIANALTPVTGRLIETDSFRRLASGHYLEVFSLDGAVPTVVASLLVFVLVWLSTRVILERWNREDWGRIGAVDRSLSGGPILTPMTVAALASEVNK